jgi:BRCA1-like protein
MGERNQLFGGLAIFFAVASLVGGAFWLNYSIEDDSLKKLMVAEGNELSNLNALIDTNLKEGLPAQQKAVEESIKTVTAKIEGNEAEGVQGVKGKIKDTADASAGHLRDASTAGSSRGKKLKERETTINEAVTSLGSAYRELVELKARLITERKKHETDLKTEQDKLYKAMISERGRADEVRKEIATIREEVVMLQAKISRMRERRKKLEQLNKDGTIINSDGANNSVVVNLGKRHGVRPGMLFDVFEIKRNGKKVVKAKIRLRRVENQQSFAVILAKRAPPKKCPSCGWSTTNATFRFCPYCLGGDDEHSRDAMRLSPGNTKERIVAPDFFNPVRKGDFISSPFYLGRLKNQAFVFAIVGQTVDHSAEEIRMFLKEHGCTLQSSLTLDTDFAVVGIGPKVDQGLEKAQHLGISVIREGELFDFFGKLGTSADTPLTEE